MATEIIENGNIKKEDKRVRRTKRILESSLTDLLEKKPLQEITVRELTEYADMNRGTFYLYYKDVFDMVNKIEDEYFARFKAILDTHEDETVFQQTRSFLIDLFSFIKENQRLCHVLLGKHGDFAFMQRLTALVREKCHSDWITQHKDQFARNEMEFDYRYGFATEGCLGVIRPWLERGCREDPIYMAELTEVLVRGGSLDISAAAME